MLALYVSGDLERSESEQLAKHLDVCSSCRSEFGRLSEIATMLSPANADSLTDMEKLRIETEIYRQLAEKANRDHPLRKGMSVAKVLLRVAAALLLLITGYSARSLVSELERPSQPTVKTLRHSPKTTKYRQALASGLRFSPEGFKVIAGGRSALETGTEITHD
jgi:predicted anti-sigma-YlaC factor YlaD